jgi:hypothetical protein
LKSKLSLLKKDLDIAVITPGSKSTQLQKSIEKLPEDQKYSAMVVHYGMKAADARRNKIKFPGQNKALNVLHSLCAEMNQGAIKLDQSAMKAYIDTVVTDRDLESVSLALRILKSGKYSTLECAAVILERLKLSCSLRSTSARVRKCRRFAFSTWYKQRICITRSAGE